jgi:hypothetical protein
MDYMFSLYSILPFFVCCQHTVAVMVRAIARSLLGMAENGASEQAVFAGSEAKTTKAFARRILPGSVLNFAGNSC